LKRGVEVTSAALRRSLNSTKDGHTPEELTVSFTEAYGATLKRYHNMVVKPMFTLAMKSCPYRQEFYEKLGEDQVIVKQRFEVWLTALEKIAERLNNFYKDGGYDKGF